LHPVAQQIKNLPGHIDSDSPDLKCREIVANCAKGRDQVIENRFFEHEPDALHPDSYHLSGCKFINFVGYEYSPGLFM
jgi:hypothetical protein